MITAEGPDPVALFMILVRWVLGTQHVPALDSAARVLGFLIVGYLMIRMVRVDLADWRRRRRRPKRPLPPDPGSHEPGAP